MLFKELSMILSCCYCCFCCGGKKYSSLSLFLSNNPSCYQVLLNYHWNCFFLYFIVTIILFLVISFVVLIFRISVLGSDSIFSCLCGWVSICLMGFIFLYWVLVVWFLFQLNWVYLSLGFSFCIGRFVINFILLY